MRISDISVDRPVTITMIVLGILLLGSVSLGKLGIDLYPELNFPVAAVVANYPGAGPEEVESQVSRPLEEILGTVSNVESINSTSSPGSSIVLIMFNWGTDTDLAALKMREKVDQIKDRLPDDVDTPTVLQVDPASMPILQIGLTGGQDLTELQKLADDVIKNRLERIEGVASVSITGGLVEEVQIKVDSSKLSQYNLSLNQVTQTLQSENLNLASGSIEDGTENLLVRTMGQIREVDEIKNIIISGPNGIKVKVRDIAQVEFTTNKPSQFTRVNQKPSLSINILKQSGSNLVTVANEVKSELELLKKEVPANVELYTVVDQSEFIKQSINGLVRNIVAGGTLAVAVLMIFLRNIRSTLIISVAIPFSIIATFIMVYFAGITLNVMSLGGLALGVGMMVDSAIVILENIYRYRQNGYGYIDAAKKGSGEVGTAVMASTLTTVAVFLPIVFVEGLAAELFSQLALSVSFALLASLIVALTLIPMLSSKMLKVENELDRKSKFFRFKKLADTFGVGLEALDSKYRSILKWSLNNRKKVVGLVTVAMIASFALVPMIGAEFIPAMDSGQISVTVELPKGSVIGSTAEITNQAEEIIKQVPEVQTIFTSIGSTGGMEMGGQQGSNLARLTVKVGAKETRDRETEAIAEELRQSLKKIPGAKISVSQAEAQMGMGSPINVVIKGDDLETLKTLAKQTVNIISSVEGTRNVENSLEETTPEIQLLVDRQKAGQLGISASQVATAVRTAVTGSVVSTYRVDGKEYDIRVQIGENELNYHELENVMLTAPSGVQVPLKQVVKIDKAKGPNSIGREDQSRVVNITSNIIGRDLQTIMKDIQQEMAKMNIPDGYVVEYGGQNEEMVESFQSLGLALILSIILVYMVLASQFESLLHPFVIMFSMPTVFIGVAGGLALTGRSFSVPAFIGLIMLAGIVVNNAIVLVDYINTLRSRGKERFEAIIEAGPTRLRPILMTTLTTVLALVPITLGIGEGSESQAPMGTVVVFGLSVSTVFTLVFVPVIYTLMDDLSLRFKKKRSSSKINHTETVEG